MKSLIILPFLSVFWGNPHLVGDIVVQAHHDHHGKTADHTGEGRVQPFRVGDLGREPGAKASLDLILVDNGPKRALC